MPQTDFILIRPPLDQDINFTKCEIIKNDNHFNFDNYSFLRMNDTNTMEEWVPTKNLKQYQQEQSVK